MAKERPVSELGQPSASGAIIPTFGASTSPAQAEFDKYLKLLRNDPLRQWNYFSLEWVDFCKPIIIT